jgi:uncharacterized protein involved in exopolysaccharide biosynthesis
MEDSQSTVHKFDSKGADAATPAQSVTPEPRPFMVYPSYDPAHMQEEDSIDLLELWGILARRKGLIAAIVLLVTAAATATALLMTPIFRAEVVMAPVTEEKSGGLASLANQFGGLASLAGVNLGGGGSDTKKVLATLTSRAFLLPYIKDQALMPVLYADAWDARRNTWQDAVAREPPTPLQAYKRFVNDILSVREDSKTGIVTLGIEWKDPRLAAQWANQLVARLNEHQRQLAINDAQKSIDYLKQQLQQTDVVDMQQAIYRLIEVQTKTIMLANIKKDYAMEVIDPAVVPEKKIKPKRSLIVVMGVVLGLVVAVFTVFFLQFLQNVRRTTGGAEE